MHGQRANPLRRARQALLCAVLGFAALQILAAAAVEFRLDAARDPEFAAKLTRLRARLESAPGSPLVLLLGSSRTLMGFQAGKVLTDSECSRPVVFNFGIRGAGPMLELVCLRRLLAAGIRPDLLFVEVIPPVLNQRTEHPLEQAWLNGGRLTLAEIGLLGPFHSQRRRLLRHWLKARAVPWSSHRKGLRDSVVGETPEDAGGWDDPDPGPIDEFGWQPFFERGIDPDRRRHFWDIARRQYDAAIGDFRLASRSARCLEALLDLCGREGIPVALVLFPEGNAFTALYPASMREGIDAFLENLSRTRGVRVIDARGWLGDEHFWDAHHQLPSGAAAFTARFQWEVLRLLPREHALCGE